MAIDLSELIHDPDFCTNFIVERKTESVWSKGEPTYETQRIPVEGIVAPTSSKDLQLVPEGDRRNGTKTFYTDINMMLKVSDTDKTSDVCIWNGERYKLVNTWNYAANGFYYATGYYTGEDDGS